MRQPHSDPLFSSQFLEKNVTGGHAEKNAVDAGIDAAGGPFSLAVEYEANAANPLIKSPPAGDTRQACEHGEVPGTTTLERAAALIGIEPKRLLGRIWRNSVQHDDPMGCPHCGRVYVDSLRAGERGSVVNEVAP